MLVEAPSLSAVLTEASLPGPPLEMVSQWLPMRPRLLRKFLLWATALAQARALLAARQRADRPRTRPSLQQRWGTPPVRLVLWHQPGPNWCRPWRLSAPGPRAPLLHAGPRRDCAKCYWRLKVEAASRGKWWNLEHAWCREMLGSRRSEGQRIVHEASRSPPSATPTKVRTRRRRGTPLRPTAPRTPLEERRVGTDLRQASREPASEVGACDRLCETAKCNTGIAHAS